MSVVWLPVAVAEVAAGRIGMFALTVIAAAVLDEVVAGPRLDQSFLFMLPSGVSRSASWRGYR